MWKTRLQLIGGILIATVILLILRVPQIVAAIVLPLGVIGWYLVSSIRRYGKRTALLNTAMDPDLFIEKTRVQMDITGRKDNISRALLTMDIAVGYISRGEFDLGLERLDKINQEKLSYKNNSKLIYTINRIVCLYELGRIDEGEQLFESQLTRLAPVNNYARQMVDRVVCERYYFLERYDDYKEAAKALREGERKLAKRSELGLVYRLAQIAEREGDQESALAYYEEVARDGNQLWIAKESRIWLKAHR